MAERSMASSAAVGCAAFSSAVRWTGRLAGDAMLAAVPGAKENPVIVPPALRLTRAVACCHQGFLAGCTESPSFQAGSGTAPPAPARRRGQKCGNYAGSYEFGICLRMAWTRESPGLLAFANSTA